MKTFTISDKEWESCQKFKEEHKQCAPNGFSTLGMQYTYSITPGGLGPCVSIKCNACGDEIDVTDSDSW